MASDSKRRTTGKVLAALSIVGLLLVAGVPGLALWTSAGASHGPAHRDDDGSVWRVRTHVDADVVDSYATVQVTATITNDGPDPEFPFAVRVPDDAFVSGLRITRNGEVHEAEIKPRDQARREYEDWKDKERTAGLVERTRGTSVYRYLVNVEGFERVEATLTYEVHLGAHRGVYTLPLEAPVSGFGQDQGASFEVTVRHTEGVEALWSEPNGQTEETAEGWHLSYAVGPRRDGEPTSLDVHYSLSAGTGSLVTTVRNGTGYFAHRLRARPDTEGVPVDLVMVLDTSGSMSGTKIDQLRDAAAQVVRTLNASDRLHVVAFDSRPRSLWQGLREATSDRRQQAVQELGSLIASGGTNIHDAVGRAFEVLDPGATGGERAPVVVVLTDGRGDNDPALVLDRADDANRVDAQVYGIAFGDGADWSLIHGLARQGDGLALRVPEGQGAEVDIRRFLEALSTPVLSDVRVSYADGIDARDQSAPTLYKGSELLVVGTFDPSSVDAVEGTLRANRSDGRFVREFSVPVDGSHSAPFLPRLVAYQRIQALQDRIDAEGERDEWVSTVRDLAMEHGFVTDRTSLVVRLPEQPDQPQRVERGPVEATGDGAMQGSRPGGSTTAPVEAGERPTIPGFEAVALVAAATAALLVVRRPRD